MDSMLIPKDLHLLELTPCKFPPFECGRSVTCFSRLRHKWWNVPPVNRSHKILTSMLLADALSCWLWWYKLPHSQLLCAEAQITSSCGWKASKKVKPLAQQLTWNWMPPKTTWTWEQLLPQLNSPMRPQAWLTSCLQPGESPLKQRIQLSCVGISDPRNCEIINMSFYVATLWW